MPQQTIFDLVNSAQQFTNSETNYLKVNVGVHRFRFCPTWRQDELPVRLIIHHSEYKTKDGNIRLPLCYKYVFNPEDLTIFNILANEKKVITKKEIELYQKYNGCIYCKISDVISNMFGKTNNKSYARKAYFMNVLNRADNTIKIWRVGDKIMRDLSTFAAAYPNMFDVNNGIDFMVSATGEKFQRRYMITPVLETCALGVDLNTVPLHDLDTAMADGYTNINTAMELIISSYPNVMPIIGLNPNDWLTNTVQG